MKINKPVTNEEVSLKDNDRVVSKTDLNGLITYANDDFLRISGYSLNELIGKSHNIIRHPDMPQELFKDMWDSLKKMRPWTGIIKNRCKNGNYYWVLANVTPYYENDKLVGYMSVRIKPDADKIKEISSVYQLLREGALCNFKIKNGNITNITSSHWFKSINLSIKSLIASSFSFLTFLLLVIGAIGIYGLQMANDGMFNLYNNRTFIMGLIINVDELQRENQMLVVNSLMYPTEEVIEKNIIAIDQNIKTIDMLLSGYLPVIQDSVEKKLAEEFISKRNKFVSQGLKQIINALQLKNYELAEKIRINALPRLFEENNLALKKVMKLQINMAKLVYEQAESRYSYILKIEFLLILSGLFVSLWIGYVLFSSIARPLNKMIKIFLRISQGNYQNEINVIKNDEIGQLMNYLKAMQIKCGYEVAEYARISFKYFCMKKFLDNADVSLMIVNEYGDIIYVNKSFNELIKLAEADIRKDVPYFSVLNLVGTSIDILNEGLKNQIPILSSIKEPRTVSIKIGDWNLIACITPVLTDNNLQIGNFMEWQVVDKVHEARGCVEN